jgi:hypothetical protein
MKCRRDMVFVTESGMVKIGCTVKCADGQAPLSAYRIQNLKVVYPVEKPLY